MSETNPQCQSKRVMDGIEIQCALDADHEDEWHADEYHGVRWLDRAPALFKGYKHLGGRSWASSPNLGG